MPRISIVTPSYNQGRFIEETIRSILLQGYPDLEYIVIDDCSQDQSLAIVEKYRPWLMIRVHPQNRGMSATINAGWQLCTGDIITWLASDDVYLPGTFERLSMHWPELHGCGFATGAFINSDESSRLGFPPALPRLPSAGPLDLSLIPPEQWRLHIAATFFVREALDRVGRSVREDLRCHMDRELMFRLAKRNKVFLIPETVVAFRRHGENTSFSLDKLIPFGEEFARVYLMFVNDNPAENRIRRRIARQRIATEYLRYAKYTPSRFASARALLKCLRLDPHRLARRDY